MDRIWPKYYQYEDQRVFIIAQKNVTPDFSIDTIMVLNNSAINALEIIAVVVVIELNKFNPTFFEFVFYLKIIRHHLGDQIPKLLRMIKFFQVAKLVNNNVISQSLRK